MSDKHAVRLKPDAKALKAKKIKTRDEGDVRHFTLPDREGEISVRMVGDELELFPQRSAAHRALMAALG